MVQYRAQVLIKKQAQCVADVDDYITRSGNNIFLLGMEVEYVSALDTKMYKTNFATVTPKC